MVRIIAGHLKQNEEMRQDLRLSKRELNNSLSTLKLKVD